MPEKNINRVDNLFDTDDMSPESNIRFLEKAQKYVKAVPEKLFDYAMGNVDGPLAEELVRMLIVEIPAAIRRRLPEYIDQPWAEEIKILTEVIIGQTNISEEHTLVLGNPLASDGGTFVGDVLPEDRTMVDEVELDIDFSRFEEVEGHEDGSSFRTSLSEGTREMLEKALAESSQKKD